MIFAIKMLLDNIYGLLNLFEFKINHFNSLVQAKSEFKNSNFGGKYIEIMSSLMFSNKYDFSIDSNSAVSNSAQIFLDKFPRYSRTPCTTKHTAQAQRVFFIAL